MMLPNVFSPNNDGVNDGFRAYFADRCIPDDFTLEIYDRWGGLIYRSQDPNAAWDGRFRGKLNPQGVYIYRCRAVFPNGKTLEEKGDVTLLR